MKSLEIKAMELEGMSRSEMQSINGGCLLKVIKFLKEAYEEWRKDTFGK